MSYRSYDKDLPYARRDYDPVPWDRDWERPRDWDHARRDFDDRDRVSRGLPPPPIPAPRPPFDAPWDRRDRDRIPPPPRDRGGDHWAHPPSGAWPRGPERDPVGYRDLDRGRVERPRGWWEPGQPPPKSNDINAASSPSLTRKRENDGSDRGDYTREPPTRDARGGPDDKDWKRRKIDLDEFDASAPHSTGDVVENDPHEKKKTEPGEPSQHVIFLGLDPEHTEADLHAYLTSMGATIESVTIIRDRVTGLSRTFGFAQFADVASASSFVLPNFPFITMPAPAPRGPPGFPNPSKTRRIKIDFSQSAGPAGAQDARNSVQAKGAMIRNDGTRDIGSAPAPVLLLRSMEKSTTIDEVAEALQGADGQPNSGVVGMKRVLLIRDRSTDASWGFAFIEMIDVDTASELLAAIMNPKHHPTGFRISTRLIAASFALPYAFQLLPRSAPRDSWCIVPSKAVGGVDEGEGWTRYWDEAATIEEKTYEVVMPKPKVEEKPLVVKSTAVAPTVSAPAAPTALPSNAGTFSMKLKTKDVPDGKVKAGGNALGFQAEPMEVDKAEDDNGVNTSSSANNDSKSSVKIAPMAASSKVASNINKWNQAKEGNAGNPAAVSPAKPVPIAPAPDVKPGDPGFEYGDPVALTCLLCLRQLKSLTQLQRHNNESDMHKANLRRSELCRVAKEKVASARRSFINGHHYSKKHKTKSPPTAIASNPATATQNSGSAPSVSDDAETIKYRDRAQERRRVHNQPEVPILNPDKSRLEAPESTPVAIAPAPSGEPGKDESNVGNKLLKKMGWSEGTGLGAEGEGRAEPVKAAVYVAGAGLGASKGKEVVNFSGTTYGEAAKEAARERYEQ